MNTNVRISKIIDLTCIVLIALTFLSKLSLKWSKLIPYSVPPFIYQYGIHPYINFGLQFILALVLLFIWLKVKAAYPLSPIYKLFIFSLISVLFIQTLFQITLVNINSSILVQMAGLGMAIFLIVIYGVVIPSLFDIEKCIYWIKKSSVFLVVTSIMTLPLFYKDMFRGGRFVGFFKHIPHMVTASTVAFIFYFPSVFENKKWTLKSNTPIKILITVVLGFCVLLTSTKAAMGTIIITLLVGAIIFGTKKRSFRLFKFSFLASVVIAIIFIGAPTSEYIYDITTGKVSFGMRQAQDGVSTRMEEITRGWNIFEKSPYFGMGLLYKFLNNEAGAIEVESYNSFKDPHNLFVSAAVIGGYPLFVMAIIGYVLMVIAAFKSINHGDTNRALMGLFLLSHLPVFVIYHAHFSLGGLADRIYWLVFGYLGQLVDRKQIIENDLRL